MRVPVRQDCEIAGPERQFLAIVEARDGCALSDEIVVHQPLRAGRQHVLDLGD